MLPVGDESAELADVSDRRRQQIARMRETFEPVAPRLTSMGYDWEIMAWRVGISTAIGRLLVAVRKKKGMHLILRNSEIEMSDIPGELGWRMGEVQGRFLAQDVSMKGLLQFLETVGERRYGRWHEGC